MSKTDDLIDKFLEVYGQEALGEKNSKLCPCCQMVTASRQSWDTRQEARSKMRKERNGSGMFSVWPPGKAEGTTIAVRSFEDLKLCGDRWIVPVGFRFHGSVFSVLCESRESIVVHARLDTTKGRACFFFPAEILVIDGTSERPKNSDEGDLD